MIASEFERAAKQNPNSMAIVDGDIGLTYSELMIRARLVGRYLTRELGLQRGDRVAFQLPNCWEFAASFFAVAGIGAICIPVSTQWRRRELEWCGETLELAAVITLKELSDPWCDMNLLRPGRILTVEESELFSALGSASAGSSAGWSTNRQIQVDDPVLYLLTSGSTGRPKVVPRTHANLLAGARNVARELGVAAGQRFLSVVPFHHANGFSNCMFLPLMHKATVVMMRRFNPRAAAALSSRERVEVLIGSPFIFRVLADCDFSDNPFASVKVCLSSGAAMPTETRRRCKDLLGLSVRELYGSTETGTIAVETAQDDLEPGTLGKPLDSVCVRIVDSDGSDLPPDGVGEVLVTSPAVMSGYVRTDPENAPAFHDGFFRTGDLGRLDWEGNLTLCGRARPMINLSGIKVDPVEVETVVEEIPEVVNCRVTEIEGSFGSTSIKAVVTLRPGGKTARSAIVEHCRKNLAEHKVPRVIKIFETQPEDLMGKTATNWEE